VKAGWRVVPLGEVTAIGAGNPAPQDKADFEGGAFPFIRTSDVGQIRFGDIATSADMVNEKCAKKLRLVPKGTVLFPKSGASTFLNHRVITTVDAYVSSHLATITAKPNHLDPRFLLYALSRVRAQELLPENSYPSLNLSLLGSATIPLPPLDEQKRIVAVLDEAFEGLSRARANAEANLTDARELLGVLRDQVIEADPDCDQRLENFLAGITYGFTNPMPDADEGPFKITAKNVVGGVINYGTARRTTEEAFINLLTDKSRPQLGDVLLTKDGTLGRTAVVDRSGICINQSVAVLSPNSKIIPEYLAEMLATNHCQKQMIEGAGGTTIKHLYITRVPKVQVSVPPLGEQEARLEWLAVLREQGERLLSHAKHKLDDLNRVRQSLLQKAFSGELT